MKLGTHHVYLLWDTSKFQLQIFEESSPGWFLTVTDLGFLGWSRSSNGEIAYESGGFRLFGDGVGAFLRSSAASLVFLALLWVIAVWVFPLRHIGFQDRCTFFVLCYSRIRGNPRLQLLLSARSLRWSASDYQRGKFCDTFSVISVLQTGMILWVRSLLRLIRLLHRLLRLRTQVRSCFSNWLVSSSLLCGDRWLFALQNWFLGSKVNVSLIFMLFHISSWLILTAYCFLLRFSSFMSGMFVLWYGSLFFFWCVIAGNWSSLLVNPMNESTIMSARICIWRLTTVLLTQLAYFYFCLKIEGMHCYVLAYLEWT